MNVTYDKPGQRARLRTSCALALLLAACADGDASPGAPTAPPHDTSDETPACVTDEVPEPARLRRLTMTQYQNTIRDLVHLMLSDGTDADAVIAKAALDGLPNDRREPVPQDLHGSYRRLDQALEQVHVDGAFRVGTNLSAALTETTRFGQVVGACAVDDDTGNDAACFEQFVRRFGARVLRRPIDDDDVNFYREVYGTDTTASSIAYGDVINVMLNSPDFLYFVEHGTHEVSGKPGVYELSAHELAARLSYHFWQTLPDQPLWQAAEDGSLLRPEVYQSHVQRMLLDSRTYATMEQFFADWLKVEELAALGQSQDPVYRAFAGSDLPSPALRQHMIEDVLDMAWYYTWTQPAGLPQLFSSELSFARERDLATIYGVEPWDGLHPPPQLPAGQRPGLLTRALFLANGSANTRPIMKGVFVRRRMLCDDIPPPPPGVNAMPPELRDDMTTRQTVEAVTEQPDSECAACHATVINPLGFATENFDALGRFRTEQRLFDATGMQVGSMPIDTRSVPRVTTGDDTVSNGPADLARLLLQSGKLEACFARNYFRFTFGRWEDTSKDACVLERLRARLVRSNNIASMLAEIALTPEFRQRTFD